MQTPAKSLTGHLFAPGPKHVLALDGGGIRGVLTLAFLERAEALLAEHHGTGSDFRLSDHFALIGGTSTGSIIATGLALGYSVDQLIRLYCDLSDETFARPRLLGGLWQAKFDTVPLMATIQREIGNTTLGSSSLRCGLAIVAKRLDTESVWLFHNHPRGRFYSTPEGQSSLFTSNKDLPLAQLIRASTAAPTYFDPQFIEVAPGVSGTFVDGAVSPHNNPALALFMLATMHGYGFLWPTGSGKLQIVSIGTGSRPRPIEPAERMTAAGLGLASAKALMMDCVDLVERLMQWMGEPRNAEVLDSEIGDLAFEFPGAVPLFGYARYDVRLEQDWLLREAGHDIDSGQLQTLMAIDRPDAIDLLLEIGRTVARRRVHLEHLVA